MAIAIVQEDISTATASPNALSLTSAPTSGNVLVAVMVTIQAVTLTPSTPSGWSVIRNTDARAAAYWKVSNGTEQTDSFTYSGVTATRLICVELTGADTTSPVDTTGYANFATTSTAETLVTDANMSQDNDIAIGILGMQGTNGGGETASNSFTVVTSGDTDREVAARRIYSGTGSGSTATSLFSWTTLRAGQWMIVAMKEAAAVGGPTPIPRVGPDRRAGN